MIQKHEIKVGTKVVKDGYPGTVVRMCEWNTDLVEVRLASGLCCVSKSTFDGRYDNNRVVGQAPPDPFSPAYTGTPPHGRTVSVRAA